MNFMMLRALVPPGFDLSDLHENEGRHVAADWWEENGDAKRANVLRNGHLLEPHFPLAMICERSPST